MAVVLGKYPWEVDQLPISELRTLADFDDEFCGLMLPSEAAGIVAAAMANFSGNAKEYLDPEQFLPIRSQARLGELQRKREMRAEARMKEQAILDQLNAAKEAAVAQRRAQAKKQERKNELI